MTPFVKNLQIFIQITLFTLISGEIVRGKCPQVNVSHFNCTTVLENFKQHDYLLKKQIKSFFVYGFLPLSSMDSVNSFAFNFTSDTMMGQYFVELTCNDVNYYERDFFEVFCRSNVPPPK